MNQQKLLEAACRQCDLDDCIKEWWNHYITDKFQVVRGRTAWHLNTYSQNPLLSSHQLHWISLLNTKGTEAKRKMSELLASCAGKPSYCCTMWIYFEPHAIVLAEGALILQVGARKHERNKTLMKRLLHHYIISETKLLTMFHQIKLNQTMHTFKLN
jgi:hypothetical protein